jgi:hypothetical protein
VGGTSNLGGHLEWLRAAGLLAATALFSVFNPGLLIAVPFALLVTFNPHRTLLGVALAALGVALVVLGSPPSGLWYVERGWALLVGACFVALSIRWPDVRFLGRGLGAVLGAFMGMGLLFSVRPGDWAVVDWAVRSRIEVMVSTFFQSVRMSMGPEALPEGFEAQTLQTLAMQSFIFPALLGLASLSALGCAWFLFRKVGRSPEEALGSIREFRFNDQLVWILIAGFVALLASSGAVERIGVNAVVFMGTLYALRGVGVVLAIKGGFSVFGWLLLAVGFVILAPFVIMGAAFIGLGDTWFDLRRRAFPAPPGA